MLGFVGTFGGHVAVCWHFVFRLYWWKVTASGCEDLLTEQCATPFLSPPSLPLNSADSVADIFVCVLEVFAYVFTSGSLCL